MGLVYRPIESASVYVGAGGTSNGMFYALIQNINYRKVSNIRRTKFQNLNDYRPVLQMSLPNLLKPCIKSRMKM